VPVVEGGPADVDLDYSHPRVIKVSMQPSGIHQNPVAGARI